MARIAGACWMVTILAGMFAMFIGSGLIVSGDAAATGKAIMDNQVLLRVNTAAHLIAIIAYLGATVLVYELLKPVSRTVSLLAMAFSLVGCAAGAGSRLFDFAPFVFFSGAGYLKVFTTEQLQALVLGLLNLRNQAGNIGLVFFGFHCFFVGWLIVRSTFMPKIVGVLMIIGGAGWMLNIIPPLIGYLGAFAILPGFIGELTLTLWLLIKGVNSERWKEREAAGYHA